MTAVADQEFPELAELVSASFPEIACLRCGHKDFYLEPALERKLRWFSERMAFGPNLPQDHDTPVITLICSRCGHVEQHVTALLKGASKPISGPVDGE